MVFAMGILTKNNNCILGCRQAVRHRTLTPASRGFESRQPNQNPKAEAFGFFCTITALLHILPERPAAFAFAAIFCYNKKQCDIIYRQFIKQNVKACIIIKYEFNENERGRVFFEKNN